RIVHVAVSGNGRRVATADLGLDEDGPVSAVRVWDADAEQFLTAFTPARPVLGSLALSTDGERLAFDSYEREAPGRPTRILGLVKVWDVRTSRETLTLRGHRERISALAFSADGSRLASADFDDTVHLWDARRGVLLYA